MAHHTLATAPPRVRAARGAGRRNDDISGSTRSPLDSIGDDQLTAKWV
jgi:hypothetical protein